MSQSPPVILSASKADVPALADVMAQGFFDHAEFRWVVPDDEARRRILPIFFDAPLRHVLATGNLLSARTSEAASGYSVIGSAAWAAPGQWKEPRWRSMLAAPRLLRAASPKALREYARRGQIVTEAIKAAHPSEPHWFLAMIAVTPAAAGTGAGSALIRSGLQRADAQSMPAYLECLPSLAGYYERFGFQHYCDIPMSEGAPEQIGMWREAVR